jgi:hypothetical protein
MSWTKSQNFFASDAFREFRSAQSAGAPLLPFNGMRYMMHP